jgi:hypothetical protein
MKILHIKPNNNSNQLNSILLSNTDTIVFDSKQYNDYFESLYDVYDDLINDKTLLNIIDMKQPRDEIHDIYYNQIKDLYKIDNNINLFNSNLLYIDDNFSYYAYNNQGLCDYIKNDGPDKHNNLFNLLSSMMKTDYNINSEVIFGDIYILKMDNELKLYDITYDDIKNLLYKTIFFTFYCGYNNNILLGNRLRFKSIIVDNNDETYEIFKNYVIFCKNNVKTCFKFYLDFDNIDLKKYKNLELTDKYNLTQNKVYKHSFSWDDITRDEVLYLKNNNKI